MTASLAMQHLLLKKRSGKLAVAALQAIRKLVHSGEVHKAEDVEAVAGAITRYGVEHGFFVEDEKEFILNTAVYTDWQSLTIEDRMGEVISFVIKQCSGWNIDLLRAVCTAAGARWISMAALPEEEAGPVREVLLVLQFAGVLELRKHLAGVVFQQVPETAAGAVQPDGRVVIMADFTVVAAQECDPDVLFECAGFCKVNSLDRVYHGTIDRGILVEALGAGIKGDRVLSFLKQWNAPENVIASVREWIREFNRLSLSTGPLLLCAEAAVAGQIAASELLLPWLERLDVNSVFRIKPGGERAVRDIVRKLGFDERMPQWECEPPDVAIGADEFLAAGEDPPRWNLVVDQEPFSAQAGPAIRGSKYGAEMKTLELSEVVQVIDYAILTGQRLVISYEGSPYVRRGTYTVIPLMSGKGVEPMLDAELERTGSRKQFYIKKIGAVGVIPQ